MVEFDSEDLLVVSRVIQTPIGPLRGVVMSHFGERGIVAHLYELRGATIKAEHACSWLQSPVRLACDRNAQLADPRVSKAEELLDRTSEQLQEYFLGERFDFDIPMAFQGTDFQMKVWRNLLHIDYAESKTYRQLATEIGHPRSYRAVGATLAKNRLWIVLPCHRVIGQTGKLVGYAGGLGIKHYLIELEKRCSIG